MQNIPILAPAALLVLWSMFVLVLLAATRFPAFAKAGIKPGDAEPGTRYADVEKFMPAKINWVSYNYTHLMEQPTIFYAVVAILALAGEGAGLNATLAWCYFGFRVVHSIWQCFFGAVPVRIALFTISSLILFMLAINAVTATVF